MKFQQVERFFTGKKFAIVGFEEEAEQELGEWVEEAGGELVFKDFAGTLDYLGTAFVTQLATHA